MFDSRDLGNRFGEEAMTDSNGLTTGGEESVKRNSGTETRLNEWFVPKFGPTKFRVFIGILFLPYTGMCISFALIGSMMVASPILWDRVVAISAIYALALGVAAHAADTIGSAKVKPWGAYFGKRLIILMIISSLGISYSIGIYYMLYYVPLLWVVAILEGFFLVAYNFELFGGFFHNDFWFVISWGFLPVLAGYIMQTNSAALGPLLAAAVAGSVSYIEIRLSRPYKELKKTGTDTHRAAKLESQLKLLSGLTIAFAASAVAYRLIFH